MLSGFNLSVNTEKPKFINFNQNNNLLSVFIDDREIEEVNSLLFLGVHIDNRLEWNTHVQNLLSRLSSAIYLLRRISQICDPKSALLAYHSIFHSILSYCLINNGATTKGNLDKVLKLQKYAKVLFILSVERCNSTATMNGVILTKDETLASNGNPNPEVTGSEQRVNFACSSSRSLFVRSSNNLNQNKRNQISAVGKSSRVKMWLKKVGHQVNINACLTFA